MKSKSWSKIARDLYEKNAKYQTREQFLWWVTNSYKNKKVLYRLCKMYHRKRGKQNEENNY